jgi:hypothetical protein
MDDDARAFLQDNHAAAMITLRKDGTPHAVRVGIGLHGDKIWSSGTQARLRTKHIRRDPRATLFVFDSVSSPGFRYLTLECMVVLLEGEDAQQMSVGFFRDLQSKMSPAPPPGKLLWYGQPKTEEEFLQSMRAEGRLLYEFTVHRAYGMYGGMPPR